MKITDFTLTTTAKAASTVTKWKADDPIIGSSNSLKVALNKKPSSEKLAKATKFKEIKGPELEYSAIRLLLKEQSNRCNSFKTE